MKRFKKYVLILPIVALTSCGFYADKLVPGSKYNSPIFEENYYRHWDKELKKAKLEEEIDVTSSKIIEFKKLEQIDPNFSLPGHIESAEEYGASYRMSDIDDSFKYGYQSKLFDGQMVCGAQDGHIQYAYQLGRVQVDQKGFSVRFDKESSGLHYFAMQFKATTDNTVDCYPIGSSEISPVSDPNHDDLLFHNSTIKLNTTLYTKKGNKIIAHPFVSMVNIFATDSYHHGTNDGHYYLFYAFDLSTYQLSRLVGVSISYTIVDDPLISYNEEKGIHLDYALMLYEMFFPYTTWN